MDQPAVMSSRDAAMTFGQDHVRWMVNRGQWQRPAKGVIVRHSGQLTYDEQLATELILQGQDAAFAGLTAATMEGLRNFTPTTIDIVTVHGATVRRRPGVTVRRSRLLTPDDVHPARELRRTRLPRSIIDAAAWASTDLRRQAIIAASVQQRLVIPSALDAVVKARPNLPHRSVITETVRDVGGGSLSEWELLFEKLRRRRRWPTPTRQRSRKDAAGRWRYLDLDFDDFDLVVEIDGQQHMEALAWWEDMMRNNELVVIEGKTLLRFAGFALRRQSDRVAEVLELFFRSRGWTP